MKCACQCGQETKVIEHTNSSMGRVKGEFNRFVTGHNRAPYRNGRSYMSTGYAFVRDSDGKRFEHVRVAEKALGHPLPVLAIVHHINKDQGDNRPNNLIICESQAYHLLLHLRERAFNGCGKPNWKRCSFCKKWDDPKNLYLFKRTATARHRECGNAYKRRRYHAGN